MANSSKSSPKVVPSPSAVQAPVESRAAQEPDVQQAASHEHGAQDSGAVVVEIYDQVYQLRGPDPEHIERLAAVVDAKMRAVSAHGATVDSLRVAVLAALNIADEHAALQARYDALADSVDHVPNAVQASVQSRADSLMGMLDELLERKAG